MVLEADGNGCVREVMVIAAALSIQDPRERPAEKQQAADEKHRRFADKESDFLAYLNLWNYLQEQQKELSSSAFRRLCKAEFLNYLRVREWQDIYGQLRQMAKSLGVTLNSTPGDEQKIHVSLLSGLLSHIGRQGRRREEGHGDGARRPATEPRRPFTEYIGARNARFAIFPGSALAKKQPRWVMSAELVETSRLWARVNAKIEPEWVEPLAQHLVKRTYSEPHWEKKQGAVMAYEKVTLYGVPIVAQRKVNYGRIDPELCRELFIRHALVEGDWETHHALLPREPQAPGGGRGAGGAGPAPRHPGGRRDAVRLLRPARPRRRRLRPPLRLLVEEDQGRPARPAQLREVDADQRVGGRCQPARLPRRVAPGRPALPADLPVRARHRRRRRHRAHPARRCSTRSTPTASTGRFPACARSWSPR